jgi:hypothetical protein
MSLKGPVPERVSKQPRVDNLTVSCPPLLSVLLTLGKTDTICNEGMWPTCEGEVSVVGLAPRHHLPPVLQHIRQTHQDTYHT